MFTREELTEGGYELVYLQGVANATADPKESHSWSFYWSRKIDRIVVFKDDNEISETTLNLISIPNIFK